MKDLLKHLEDHYNNLDLENEDLVNDLVTWTFFTPIQKIDNGNIAEYCFTVGEDKMIYMPLFFNRKSAEMKFSNCEIIEASISHAIDCIFINTLTGVVLNAFTERAIFIRPETIRDRLDIEKKLINKEVLELNNLLDKIDGVKEQLIEETNLKDVKKENGNEVVEKDSDDKIIDEEDYYKFIECLKKVSHAYSIKNQKIMDANIYIVKSMLKSEKIAIIFPIKGESIDKAEDFFYTKDGKLIAFTCDEELGKVMPNCEYSYVAYMDDLTQIFSVTKKKLTLLDNKMIFPYMYPLFSLM